MIPEITISEHAAGTINQSAYVINSIYDNVQLFYPRSEVNYSAPQTGVSALLKQNEFSIQ